MNNSLKETTDAVIAADFKKQLASCDADIALMKNKINNAKYTYNLLISEDPKDQLPPSHCGDFSGTLITYMERLHDLEEKRVDIIAAFNEWKEYSKYTLDVLI